MASHVTYRVEEPGFEGDGTRTPITCLKGTKEGSHKGSDAPHPELSSYVPPGDGRNEDSEAVAELQEGKQHGGVPIAALGSDVPAEVTRDYMSSVKSDDKSGGFKKHLSGEGADEPTVMERIREKVSEAENHMKGKRSSVVEDPHPELAYIPPPPPPQGEKPGFFSRVEHKFGGHDKSAADESVPKGTGSSDVGTGYEEDSEEPSLNPGAVPQYDKGVKPQQP